MTPTIVRALAAGLIAVLSAAAPASAQTAPTEEKKEEKADEKPADTSKPAAGQDAPKPIEAPKPKAGPPTVKIDLDEIDQRILAIPMPPRRYIGLQVGKAGSLLAIELPTTMRDGGGSPDESRCAG